MVLIKDATEKAINTAILALNDDIEKVKASNSSSSSSGITEGETYNINISGNANTASKVKNALTLNVGGNATSYDGSSAKTVTIGSNAKLTVATMNTYTGGTTTSYDGSEAKTATIYTPDQEVNKTSSPTFNTVTAALNGNATSADKVNNVLTLNVGGTTTSYDGSEAKTVTIGSNAKLTVATTDTYTAASTTEYDGSTAKTATIYTPDQEVNKTSSPTFNTVTATLSGNAATATTADKVGHTLTITASNTYSDTATGTTTYNGAADITQNVYLPNQSLNTTDSPEFASVYLSTDNVVSYDMTSSQTMTSSQVKYPASKLTGALTADATLMLYFNTTTLVGRKSYHVLNECTTANAQHSIVITTNLGTIVTLSVKKNQAAYVTDIFVDASGNLLFFAATRPSTSDSLKYPLTISNAALSTATAYNGSSAVTVYSPGQLLESTSSPTFANPTVTTINGISFTPKWSAPFIPYVRTDGVTEIGKYVDFHGDAEDSNDYDARIAVTHNSTYRGNGEMTINAANITAAKFSMTHINLYGDSLTFTSPLSDANVSQCWAKAYGNILRIHVAMPMATQTIANSTIIFNLSGAMPTMAYSPTRLVLICDSISLGRYTADIDLDQSGVARIYFAGVAISGSVADISGIYGDCMLTLN